MAQLFAMQSRRHSKRVAQQFLLKQLPKDTWILDFGNRSFMESLMVVEKNEYWLKSLASDSLAVCLTLARSSSLWDKVRLLC